METDERTQELFDAAKTYIGRFGAADDSVCFVRLQEAVKVWEHSTTAQILGEVRVAMNKLQLANYLERNTDIQKVYRAISEAIQAWHDV